MRATKALKAATEGTAASEAMANATCIERIGRITSVCAVELGLLGLLRLAASSRHLRGPCLAAACDAAADLLAKSTAGIAAAADYGPARRRTANQHMQVVTWLLQAAPTAKWASLAAVLVCIPAVPLRYSLQLVAAGVRISYAQLLAAADNMVKGVEVWVQAQQELGVETDIPAEAVAICCDDCWDYQASPADTSISMLQLAMNCSNHGAALEAVRRIPEQLDAGAARKLLLTAAVRQHEDAVLLMAGLRYLQQHIDTTTLEQLLQHLCKCNSSICLMQLPEAAGLDSKAVVRVLSVAVQQDLCPAAEAFFGHPAARQMSHVDVLQLLQSAVERSGGWSYDARCVAELCKLPAAAELSSTTVADLLLKAVDCGDEVSIEAVCTLPAAAELSMDVAARLVQSAVMHGTSCQSFSFLETLPAVGELLSTGVVWRELLHEAVEQDNAKSVEDFCCMDMDEQLSSSEFTELLQAAVDLGSEDCAVLLCRCESASMINVEDLEQMVRTAEDGGSFKCLEALQQLLEDVEERDFDGFLYVGRTHA